MKVTILAVGKLKEKYMKEAVADYALRLTKYCKFSVTEAPECATVEKEGDELLRLIPSGAYVVALDLKGKMISSTDLAEMISSRTVQGESHFVFIIGGSDGLDRRVISRADASICMSKMTFTHQMARLIISEQIYRAMKINSGERYHK
ncbi:MAG: 23S rRNA (pseudouridine(1915)-N(3))-methyltransferase RlmH [Clostridia bacterium]|nr:23S rRNA (pseudouridine(1915)-N(3))-methyltransferase RlmH [Clostridia bacterium]